MMLEPKQDLRNRTVELASPALPRNLGEQAYEQLLELLMSGELAAGTSLQERRLAEKLAISRTPVREALGRLEAEGLIVRKAGRLTTVPELSVQAFVEVLNVRKLLEIEAADLAASRTLDRRTLDETRASIWALLEFKNPTAAEHWAVDDRVHGLIAEASDNRFLATTIRDLRRRTHIFNTRRIPGRLRPGALEHLALLDAVAAGDRTKARQLMAEHIDNVKAAIVEQLISGRAAT